MIGHALSPTSLWVSKHHRPYGSGPGVQPDRGAPTPALDCEARGAIRSEETRAMKFTPGVILLIVAVVFFLLAAFGIGLGGLDLVTLGLAAFAGAFLVDRLT